MSTARPHRRFTVELRLSGDTWEDVREMLEYAAHSLERREVVLGGPTAGYTMKVVEDPEMTNAKYHAAVEEWLGAKDAGSGKDPRIHGEADHDCG